VNVPPNPLNRGNQSDNENEKLPLSRGRGEYLNHGGGTQNDRGVQTHFEHGGFRYSKVVGEAAKVLRKKMTQAEQKLWDCLLRAKQTGYKFSRQKPIENFILDFYCSELLLCVEVDGEYHEKAKEQDEVRTERLNILGIKVVRYTNKQVLEQMEEVKTNLLNEISNIRGNSNNLVLGSLCQEGGGSTK
jgi:very-short-patch-repair endonuclease